MLNNTYKLNNVNTDNKKSGGESLGGSPFKGGATQGLPPLDNMGVENITKGQSITWHIDYLTITVWGSAQYFEAYYYDSGMGDKFGELTQKEGKKRFYENIKRSVSGFELLEQPIKGGNDERYTIILPGQTLEYFDLNDISNMMDFIDRHSKKWNVPRIDIAWDNVPFEVNEIYEILFNDMKFGKELGEDRQVKGRFERESLRFINSPGEYQEEVKGKETIQGCQTVYIGSRTSERFCRIYNKHGFTRLEIEFKQNKALQVLEDLILPINGSNPVKMAFGHLLDFIDINWDKWKLFIEGFKAGFRKLYKDIREISVEKIGDWVVNSVSRSLAILIDYYGIEFIKNAYHIGQDKLNDNPGRYAELITALGY